MTSQSRKYFVTGVAGMIGSNTARSLVRAGKHVVGIDNLWRGSKENIRDLFAAPNFTFRHADLISDKDWFRDCDDEDSLIHIADIVAGIGYVFANEWTVFQRNLLINTSVARIVAERPLARLIYLGTACSYPQALQRSVSSSVLSEKDKFPADPESGYGWSKLIGEIEFRLATKNSSTRFVTLDLHNVYGWPCTYRDSTAQVVPSLAFKALSASDGKLHVWGNGKQGRAFVHVDDVVSAIEAALSYVGETSTFMIGPSACTTIEEVAEIIRRHPRVQIDEILFDTSKPTGDIGRSADGSVARQELKWSPRVKLETGIHDLVDRIASDVQ